MSLKNKDQNNMSFDGRARLTLAQACDVAARPTNVITHVLSNADGTYSVMSHIVCEHCDYCDSQGDCRCLKDFEITPVPAKSNPYELQVKKTQISDDEMRQHLLANQWEQVLTEEDGCETWRLEWNFRKPYPEHVICQTQHYWDLVDAYEDQLKIEKYDLYRKLCEKLNVPTDVSVSQLLVMVDKLQNDLKQIGDFINETPDARAIIAKLKIMFTTHNA